MRLAERLGERFPDEDASMVALPIPCPTTDDAVEPPLPPDACGHRLPTFRQVARRALPQAVEASIVPAVILLLLTEVTSAPLAIGAALLWAVAAATWRYLRRGSVTGLSILAIVRLFVRSLIAIAAGSTFVYFLQGSIGGYCLAAAFLVSVVIDRPLARRFADDLCDLPARVLEHHRVRRSLRSISLMWGVIGLAHATVGLLLLLHLPTSAYVVVNALLSIAVPAALIAVSIAWFRRTVAPSAVVPALVTTGVGVVRPTAGPITRAGR